MTQRTLQEICCHEMGHAYAAIHYHGSVDYVAISEDGSGKISYNHRGFDSKLSYDHPDSANATTIILSGLSAMLLVSSDLWSYENCYRDLGEAEDLMIQKGWQRPEKYDLEKFYRDYGGPSRVLIRSNFKVVKALAERLRVEKYMSGQAIMEFINNVGGLK